MFVLACAIDLRALDFGQPQAWQTILLVFLLAWLFRFYCEALTVCLV
jgi:hypothetical protein